MPYTEAERSQIKRAFLRRRRNQRVLTIALAPMIFGALWYQRGPASTIFGVSVQVFGPIFLALVLGALLFSLRNWRCPGCSKYLGYTMNPKYCPNCGAELRP